MKSKIFALALVVAAILGIPVVFGGTPDFTIAVLPDTQNYTQNGGNGIFQQQVSWIVSNRINRRIVFVIHEGDNVDKAKDASQWAVATNALYMLENAKLTGLKEGIPYSTSVGNHDQHPKGDPNGTKNFNNYFGVNHFKGRKYDGGHYGSDRDNHYELFSFAGMGFLVLSIEYSATPVAEVNAWADGVLKANPSRRAIVVTHAGFDDSGNLSPQGQAIYNELKDNPNWFMMLCGHANLEVHREDNYKGHAVNSILADYQNSPNGGDGWLRLITFSPSNNTITVETYSPYLDQHNPTASSAFTLKYDMQGSNVVRKQDKTE
ncbi:MAG: hypothetical protein WCP86_05155 [bacterium]